MTEEFIFFVIKIDEVFSFTVKESFSTKQIFPFNQHL